MAETQDKRRGISTVMTALNLVLIMAGIIFVLAVTLSGYNNRNWYKLYVVLMVVGYSGMFNITALYLVRAFRNMTRHQGKCYFIYMAFDAVALCFLALFVVNAGDFDEPLHYVSLGLFLIMTIPRQQLYHHATDDLKAEWKQNYHTINSMGVFTERPARKNKAGKERFAGPVLREDRFVNMSIDEYVSGRSVDESGNVRTKK